MKYIFKIYELFNDLAQEKEQDAKNAYAKQYYYAMAYAEGEEKAYKHAAKIIEAYINHELPWEE